MGCKNCASLKSIYNYLVKHTFSQITSIKIMNPLLTSTMPRRLSDGLQSLPNLKAVTIEGPPQVTALPHVATLRKLELIGLPLECQDWQWLSSILCLEEFKITFKETNQRKDNLRTGKGHERTKRTNSLYIYKTKAEIEGLSNDGLEVALANVLDNIPLSLKDQVCTYQLLGEKLGIKYRIYLYVNPSSSQCDMVLEIGCVAFILRIKILNS